MFDSASLKTPFCAFTQVFVNLLKSDFTESKKHLVRDALDVLVPALVEQFQDKVRDLDPSIREST